MNEFTEVGKYAIVRHLGNGNFGDVYLAHDRILNAEKAIKILNIENPREFIQKFEEAELLHKCRHKHIVNINEADVYEIDGEPKVVIDIEFITGGSLEDYMERNFLSTIEATKYMRDVLFGLEHLHNQGVLHRDIKPANIMLDEGSAKLSDFGLATSAGANLVGSPNGYIPHCAPEMFSDGRITGKTTILTDIFAAGITFYRMVSNLNNWREILSEIDNIQVFSDGETIETIGIPLYVPKKIQRIINKACNRDPNKRFQNSVEMRKAIEKLQPNINWKRVEESEWQGSGQDGQLFNIFLSGTNEVIIKRNSRRITGACKKFDLRANAISYMLEYVAKTTFQR